MKLILYFLIFILFGCSAMKEVNSPHKKPSVAGIKDGVLFYEGSITQAANEAIFEAYRASEHKPTRLVINSPGGELSVGIALGSWVKANHLNVEVSELCGSACANYVFIAANKKYLRKDSILIWHGSAWQPEVYIAKEHRVALDTYLKEMRIKETAFYKKLRVDNLITIYGQSFFGVTQWVKQLFGQEAAGFDYSIEDMTQFGINNIVLLDNEWNWRSYVPEKRHKVLRVALKEDYQFTLGRYQVSGVN